MDTATVKLPVELVNQLIKLAGHATFNDAAPVIQETVRIAREQGIGAPAGNNGVIAAKE